MIKRGCRGPSSVNAIPCGIRKAWPGMLLPSPPPWDLGPTSSLIFLYSHMLDVAPGSLLLSHMAHPPVFLCLLSASHLHNESLQSTDAALVSISYYCFASFYFLKIAFIYLAVLGLHCCVGFSLVSASEGYFLVVVHGLPIMGLLLWSIWVLVAAALEKAMASHSSTLAWKVPWMEEPGRLQSMGSLRVGHD